MFDMKVEHRPGVKHGNADALSRKQCRQCQVHSVSVDTKIAKGELEDRDSFE